MPYDPTHTTTIRAGFVRQMNKRWGLLKTAIRKRFVEGDAFGLLEPSALQVHQFETNPAKIDAFIKWLTELEEQGILETVYRGGVLTKTPWSNIYIESAYRKGIQRAYAELHKADYDPPVPIEQAFTQPVHIERAELIYTRTWEKLKTYQQLTNAALRDELSDALSTTLAQGIAEGKNPKTMARELVKNLNGRIDAIGVYRSRMLARTEVIRAHHKATIGEYRLASDEMLVNVKVEWSTAGSGVCPVCAALEGRTFTLNEIENMIPVHPHCRCSGIPSAETVRPRRAA